MLELLNVNKTIGEQRILKDISLKLNKNEILAIIGPSGSGKTTLLRCLNLLETPDSGELKIGDFKIDFAHKIHAKERLVLRRKMTMVFQNFNLFAHKNALENISEGLIKVQKIAPKTAHQIAGEWLEKVGLSHRANAYPSALSGGQQQRVAIARAAALKPDILLLDEPTSALDPELVGEVLNTLKMLAQSGQAMILVTHEIRFARDVAHKMAFMEDAQMRVLEPTFEFFNSPKSERIARFISSVSGALEYQI